MLSEETISTIKSTVPLLQEHGLIITTVFYQLLFERNPELKHVFNRANQRDSTQSRALADAVLAYAENIDNLEVLLPAVSRIANKHASIGVEAHHYPLVGASLLAAIQQVLSLPDNHAALKAWASAYEVLAGVFIQCESNLYDESSRADGGWKGFRPFVISEIEPETTEVKSFTLRPKDGKAIKDYAGGQYVSVKLIGSNDGYDQIRQYSLSNWGGDYRLTIKQETEGLVSQGIHNYAVGDELLISVPFGDFNLNPNASKHVFISGGVGVTPLLSMVKEAISCGKNSEQLIFIECCRSAEHQIFKAELHKLLNKSFIQLKQAFEHGPGGDFSGRLNSDILDEWLTDKTADIYFCGPLPFMVHIKKLLKQIGFADAQIHYEVFGPTTGVD